jgi:TolB-like protein
VLTTLMLMFTLLQTSTEDVEGLTAAGALGAPSAPTAPAQRGPPSAAVMRLVAINGVQESSAELLTSNLVANLRATNHFSRVVTSSEIQALLGLEQQKQLLSCDTSSCMAELAGALGVDYVVRGELGRLGKSWVVNVSMLNTRTGQAERTVSQSIPGDDEAELLPVMKDVASQLVGQQAVTLAAQPAPQPVQGPPETKGGMLGTVLKVAGGVGLAGGALAVLVALAGGGVAGGIWGLLALNPDVTRGAQAGIPLTVGYGAGLAALGLGVVLTVLGVASGAALLVAGAVL